MATMSETIKREILSCGVSRYQISRDTKIEESALSRFVNDKRGLGQDALDILAEYFGFKLVKRK